MIYVFIMDELFIAISLRISYEHLFLFSLPLFPMVQFLLLHIHIIKFGFVYLFQ